MKYTDIKVTRAPDGFYWTAHSQFTGEPIMRAGQPLKQGPYADGWEAMSAGHSAIAYFDKDASYIIAELAFHELEASRAAMKARLRVARGKDNAERKAA
jgi:hypothetical protein